MALIESDGSVLLVLGTAFSAAWGLACGAFERLLLAPRHRLSAFGPAYAPSMTLAFLAGGLFLISEERVRFLFAVFMAGAFFILGALPAFASFHLSRWLFRTTFSNETKS